MTLTLAVSLGACSNNQAGALPSSKVSGAHKRAFAGTETILSGTVTGTTSQTAFIYETNYPSGHVPVTDSGAVIVNGPVAVNDVVTVTGSYSGSTLVASKVVVEQAVPAHIETWAYDNYNSSTGEGQGNVPAADVGSYTTYAENGVSANPTPKVLTDCHSSGTKCSAVEYVDPNDIYVNPPSTCSATQPDQTAYDAASETWFVHQAGYTDSAHRIQGGYQTSSSCPDAEYLLNQNNTAVQQWYGQLLSAAGTQGPKLNPAGDQYDVYMTDNTAGEIADQTYFYSGGGCPSYTYTNGYVSGGTICSTTQELPSDSAVVSEHAAFWSSPSMVHQNKTAMKFFFNSLSPSSTGMKSTALFGSSSNLLGGLCENCVVDGGSVKTTQVAQTLDAMLTAEQAKNSLVLLSTGTAAEEGANNDDRLAALGIDWLGYSPGGVVGFEDLEDDTHNLAVWPEQQLYPTEPLTSMTTGNADLLVPGFSSMWMREFATCYNAGSYIGRCGVVVNASGATQAVQGSWFTQTYRYYMTMSSPDLVNGGATTRTNALTYGTTQVRSGSAIFLFN